MDIPISRSGSCSETGDSTREGAGREFLPKSLTSWPGQLEVRILQINLENLKNELAIRSLGNSQTRKTALRVLSICSARACGIFVSIFIVPGTRVAVLGADLQGWTALYHHHLDSEPPVRLPPIFNLVLCFQSPLTLNTTAG